MTFTTKEDKPIKEIYFSGSDLVKKSARQIKYLMGKPRPEPTQGMLRGEEHQKRVEKEQKPDASEMRGIFRANNITIFFTNDMVKDNVIYEIKQVRQSIGVPKWYLEESLVQVAFYKSMFMQGDGVLTTPTFRVNAGYKKIDMILDVNCKFMLMFGDDTYEVNAKDPSKITDFFVIKAKACLDWDLATEFDSKFKHKNFVMTKKYFDFRKL